MQYIRKEINLNCHEGQNPDFQPAVQLYLQETSENISQYRERPMIIVCPGGAYEYRSGREAEPVVMAFLAAGFHCALMEYSVAPASWPCAARELAHAVALIRENAQEWKVKKNAVYVCGFSAGGHLAASLGVLWNHPVFEEEFGKGIEKNWRPDGMLLGYPVVTMGEFTHKVSRNRLLGMDEALQAKLDLLSLEKQVSSATVPAFLWHTGEDGSVPVENTLQLACALRKAAVPMELHIYETGGHGLALCDERTATKPEQLVPDNTDWVEHAIRWIKRR